MNILAAVAVEPEAVTVARSTGRRGIRGYYLASQRGKIAVDGSLLDMVRDGYAIASAWQSPACEALQCFRPEVLYMVPSPMLWCSRHGKAERPIPNPFPLEGDEWLAAEELVAVPRIRLEREPQGRLRYLTEDEAGRLLAACRAPKRLEQSPHLPAIVTMALHTGMRKGEIAGLTWERVDFARGVLQLEITKSGKRREVPMNRAVYDVLSALPGEKTAGPVFRKEDGRAWGNFRNAFENAVEAARIEDFRFHDLRHTFASWLVMRGRALKEVQELLGHQSITMTMTMRYAHLSPDRLRDAVAALGDFSTTSAQSSVDSHPSLVNTRQN